MKTADLDPRQNYVVGFHPHGVLVAGAFTNFCTYASGFKELFPGITSYLLMLPLWFRAPFFRDYIMCAGVGQKAFSVELLIICVFFAQGVFQQCYKNNNSIKNNLKNCIIHVPIKFPYKMQGLYPLTRRVPPIRFAKKEEVMLS